MNVLLHSMIIATSLAATVAVALASVSIYDGFSEPIAAKTDRLPLFGDSAPAYFTIEIRKDGISVLSRVHAQSWNSLAARRSGGRHRGVGSGSEAGEGAREVAIDRRRHAISL